VWASQGAPDPTLPDAKELIGAAEARALHAVTTTNALHYAWQHCRKDSTRRYVLLQNAAFLPMFRQAMTGRGQLADRQIDRLAPIDTPGSQEGVDATLAEISRSPITATGKVLGYLSADGKAEELMRAARGVLLLKANESHDYEFSGAAFEDFGSISAGWRDRFRPPAFCVCTGHRIRPIP